MPQIDGSAFRLTPDLRFLFAYGSHEDAFIRLRDSLRSRARLMLITGGFGVGKTLLLRRLEAALATDGIPAAYAAYPQLDFTELLSSVAEQHRAMHRPADGASPIEGVVLLDDADRCSNAFLTNLQDWIISSDDKSPALQFVLAGTPALASRLAIDFPGLAAAVGLRTEISPLSEGEADAYIRHRLDISGLADIALQADARNAVIQYSRGIPRLINHACARALLLAGPGQSLISQEIAREAIDDYIANASFGQAAIETPWVAPRPAAETVTAPAVAAEVRDPPPVAAAPPQTAVAEAPVAETAVAEGPVAEAPAESAIIPEPQAPDVDPPPLHTPDTDQAADQPAGALIDIPPPPAAAPQAAESRAARGKSLRPNRLLRSGRLHAQALRSDPASPSPKFAGFRRRRAAQPEQSAAPASSPPAAQQAMRRASALGWSIAAATLAGLVATLYLLQAPDGMTAVIRQSERLGRSLNEASLAIRAHLAALIEWIRRIAETLKI